MKITATLTAALLLGAGAAAALETPLDFDQGVDVSGVVKELKAETKASADAQAVEAGIYSREERDCADVSFGPDDPTTSERIELESRIYEWRCYGDGRPYPYPRDPYYPRDRYDRPLPPYIPPPDIGRDRNRDCYEEWVRTERRRARVTVAGRGQMLPWERDVFEVCLQGDWLTAHVREASHQYDIQTPGWRGDLVTANAIRKIRSQPDTYGIKESSFGFDADSGNFKLALADRWIDYYAGEKVGFTLKLRRYHKNWFDSTVLEKKLEFPAAAAYTIDFADYVAELSGKLEPGKKYYVEWGFRRLGQVSKDDWQKARETGKEDYRGKPAAPAALQLSALR